MTKCFLPSIDDSLVTTLDSQFSFPELDRDEPDHPQNGPNSAPSMEECNELLELAAQGGIQFVRATEDGRYEVIAENTFVCEATLSARTIIDAFSVYLTFKAKNWHVTSARGEDNNNKIRWRNNSIDSWREIGSIFNGGYLVLLPLRKLVRYWVESLSGARIYIIFTW